MSKHHPRLQYCSLNHLHLRYQTPAAPTPYEVNRTTGDQMILPLPSAHDCLTHTSATTGPLSSFSHPGKLKVILDASVSSSTHSFVPQALTKLLLEASRHSAGFILMNEVGGHDPCPHGAHSLKREMKINQVDIQIFIFKQHTHY